MSFSDKQISLMYTLLLLAIQAFERRDFRSAIVLGGISLEICVLEKIEKVAKQDNRKIKYPIGELGKKYDLAKKLHISFPIKNVKDDIIRFRNDVIHKGKEVNEEEARMFLLSVRTILFDFQPEMLEQ